MKELIATFTNQLEEAFEIASKQFRRASFTLTNTPAVFLLVISLLSFPLYLVIKVLLLTIIIILYIFWMHLQ